MGNCERDMDSKFRGASSGCVPDSGCDVRRDHGWRSLLADDKADQMKKAVGDIGEFLGYAGMLMMALWLVATVKGWL